MLYLFHYKDRSILFPDLCSKDCDFWERNLSLNSHVKGDEKRRQRGIEKRGINKSSSSAAGFILITTSTSNEYSIITKRKEY